MKAVQSGDTTELERCLVGRRIWVVTRAMTHESGWRLPACTAGPYRVLSFKDFLPAGPTESGMARAKHLVRLWTDPGGLRTLSVGSIKLKDPGRVAGAKAAADTKAAAEGGDDE